ncbi:unnamed protein product [Neisseria lactamica Y92-1009]|uniref:Phage associated protein n=1 Tax=Neisseria lactamica TaxID=486 RepID=A0AAU8VRC3_NEILA|nr:hypothetical protein B2G52_01710 [Neisseria lactamica]CBX22236.1 unnamed protein product [Neisseria lactamica Y92-1009]
MHTQCTSTQYVSVPLNLWREIVDTCTIGVEYSNNARSVLINTLCALNGKDTFQVWQHEDTEGSAMANINEHLRGSREAYGEMFTYDLWEMLWRIRRFALEAAQREGLQVGDLLTETLAGATNKA